MIYPSKTALCLLICLGLAPAAPCPARADSPTSHMPSAGLVILSEPHLSLTDRNQADYAFGPVNSLDTAQINHCFTLRNEANTTLMITQLQPSCHCTTVIVEKIAGHKPAPAEAADPTLSPGAELVLKVTVQLARQPAGWLSQGVFVFALGHNGPIARLHLNAMLATGITVSPTVLDFGQMKPGTSLSRKITITFDKRLATGGALPPIDVQCDPHSGPAANAIIRIAPETESVSTGSALLMKSYVVTLQPSQASDVIAHLSFASLSPKEYQGSIPYDTAADVFREMAVSVCARVTSQ